MMVSALERPTLTPLTVTEMYLILPKKSAMKSGDNTSNKSDMTLLLFSISLGEMAVSITLIENWIMTITVMVIAGTI